jgi:TRAP-type C4-dicarboxylate transport system permease small subunit
MKKLFKFFGRIVVAFQHGCEVVVRFLWPRFESMLEAIAGTERRTFLFGLCLFGISLVSQLYVWGYVYCGNPYASVRELFLLSGIALAISGCGCAFYTKDVLEDHWREVDGDPVKNALKKSWKEINADA